MRSRPFSFFDNGRKVRSVRVDHLSGQVLVVRKAWQAGEVRGAVIAEYQAIPTVLAVISVVEQSQRVLVDNCGFVDLQ